MYYAITKVKALPNYQLLLEFKNKKEKIFDVKEFLNFGISTKLKDERLFKSVRVSFDSIEWENGADLDPEILFNESILVKTLVK